MRANQLKYAWQQEDKLQNVLPPELNIFIECSDQQVSEYSMVLLLLLLPFNSRLILIKQVPLISIISTGNNTSFYFRHSLSQIMYYILSFFIFYL